MGNRALLYKFTLTGLVLALSFFASGHEGTLEVVAAGVVDEGCPKTSTLELQNGTKFQEFAAESNAGIVYDSANTALQLAKAGGLFRTATLAIVDRFNTGTAADFDEDGWVDLVVGTSSSLFIRFYKNRTYENPAPDWSDPDDIRTPKFVRTVDIEPDGGGGGHSGMTGGDFNQDGHADFFSYKNASGDDTDLDIQRIYLGKGDGTFQRPYNASASFADWGYFAWSSTNSTVFDWNRDGWPDIVFGTKANSSSRSGAVRVFLNSCPDLWTSPTTACSVKPTFVRSDVLSGVNMGKRGVNAISMADYTGDGIADLVAGSPSLCAPLRLYKGLAGGGIDTTTYDLIENGAYPDGAATVLLSADFSLNGGQDIIFGTDNWNCSGNLGGATYFHKNNLSPTPFSGGADQRLSYNNQVIGGVTLKDFDLGMVLNYDNDPDSTPDFLIADGNNSGSFYVFANRVVSQYVECGEVESGILALGDLSEEEMVVTGARLSPTLTQPAGAPDIRFYLSNEDPANWQLASPCVDEPSDYCVSFPKPVGRDVRWKAEMCSNAARTETPTISDIEISFDYTTAQEHYRAGIVVDDGVAYVGAFRQPGNRGHFYALNAGLDKTYWDFAKSLNEMSDSDRNVYTANTAGTSRLDFSTSNVSRELQQTLGVASADQATRLVAWQRSARFGIDNSSRLGSVENSTPAVLSPPSLTLWYPKASDTEKELIDTFVASHANRPTLVLFGSRDGALHAVRSIPTNISDSANGTEAWAFVPSKIANSFAADAVLGTVSAYPDGSPTLADVVLDDGQMHTVAIIGGGNGHQSVFALDVTETIDEQSGQVLGPTPLWHLVPGGVLAGQALSKPVVTRVKVEGESKFYVVMATGIATDNPIAPYTKGRNVVAVDVNDGSIVWQFKTKCPVTSDIVVFETDDDLEVGSPEIDGFIDRAIWADACGNVYKVDPAQNVGEDYIQGIGTIDTGELDPTGNSIVALFATATSDCALGEERPIVGTLGARFDNNRVTVFFGTGGIESYDPTRRNDFYAVYAETGEIRGCADGAPEFGRIEGSCIAGSCEKFYGGVVVSNTQVIITQSTDPPVGTGTCEFGSSKVIGFNLSTLEVEFSSTTSSATVSSLYGDGGAIYFATLAGAIVRLGTPRAENAGDDSVNGIGNGTSDSDSDDSSTSDDGALRVLGWKELH